MCFKRGKPAAALAVLACLSALSALYFFDPSVSRLFPPCPSQLLTGLYCPGCGTLRALHSLLHLDFVQAFAWNPLAVLILPFLPLLFFFPKRASKMKAASIALAIVLAYTLARNLPFPELDFLKPRPAAAKALDPETADR